MKKLINLFPFFLLIVFTSLVSAQEWKMETPIKLGDYCTDAFVVNDSVAYSTTINGKLFKTINGGNHWTEAHHVLGYQINGTAWGVHFTDVNNGVMPTGTGRIFKTSDGAITWQENYFDNTKILYEVYFPSADTGYVCGYPGTVLKTIDGGNNWQYINTGTTQELRDVWFTSNTTGCIISDQGDIIRTTDGGSNWTTVSANNDHLSDIEFIDENNGIVVGYYGLILKTTDGGITWDSIASGVSKSLAGVKYLSNSEVLICGNDGTILRSIDGGETYSQEGPTTFDDLLAFATFPNGLSIAVADGAMYQLNPSSGEWEMKYDEIPEAFFDRVIFTASDTGHAVGHFESGLGARAAIIKTNNGGKLWTSSFSSATQSGNIYDLCFINDSTGFAGSNPAIRTTTNGGNSNWGSINGPVGSNTAIHFFDENTGLVSTYQGIYKTVDGGSNWNLVKNTGTPGFQYRFNFVDADTGYVCGSDVLKTIDEGDSWEFLNVPLSGSLRAIQFPNDSVGYVVGDAGGLRTSDYGQTWTSISVGISGARDVYFPSAADPDSGYVLLYGGDIMKTINGGVNWSLFIDGPWDKEFDSFWFEGDIIYGGGSWGDIFSVNINQSKPITAFTADSLTVQQGQSIDFTDLSNNYPTGWQWTFQGASQSSSTVQNPQQIQYDSLGCFSVSLITTNAFGIDTLEKLCYIQVLENQYCFPNEINGTVGGDYIDGVVLEDLSNENSGAQGGSFYNDYTATMGANLNQNGSYGINITSGSWNGDTYAAWIDYNRNGLFEVSEKLGEFETTNAFEAQTINFTVPVGANLGRTRLRVYAAYGSTNLDPCGEYGWGEIEDYFIDIEPFTVGITANNAIAEVISVYPNPAKDKLYLISNSVIKSVQVFDITGKELACDFNDKQLNIQNLDKGVYQLLMHISEGRQVLKFIKQ